jgi:hypothetical protein
MLDRCASLAPISNNQLSAARFLGFLVYAFSEMHRLAGRRPSSWCNIAKVRTASLTVIRLLVHGILPPEHCSSGKSVLINNSGEVAEWPNAAVC